MSEFTGMAKDEIGETKRKLFTDDKPLSLLKKMESLPTKKVMAPTDSKNLCPLPTNKVHSTGVSSVARLSKRVNTCPDFSRSGN